MAYSDDQPRDEKGMWTSGGGGGAVGQASQEHWEATKATLLPGPTGNLTVGEAYAQAQAISQARLDQTNAVNAYVSGGDILNYFARTDLSQLSERDQGYIAGIDSAIAGQSPTTMDTVLYRGVAIAPSADQQASGENLAPPEYGAMQAGETFTDPGFASTTTNFESAQGFAKSSGTILEVHAPPGTQGLSVPAVTGRDLLNEQEVLLPRDTNFQVLEPVDPMTGIMKVTIVSQ